MATTQLLPGSIVDYLQKSHTKKIEWSLEASTKLGKSLGRNQKT